MNISPRKKLSAVIEACMAVVAGGALLLFIVMAWGMGFDVRGGNGIAAVTPRGAGKVAIRLPALPEPPEESTNEQAVARRTGAEIAGLSATSSNPQAGTTETPRGTVASDGPAEAPSTPSSDQPDSPDEVVVAVSGPVVSPSGTSPPDGDTGPDAGAAPTPKPDLDQEHNPSSGGGRSAPPKDHPPPEGPAPAAPEEKPEPQEQPPQQEDGGEGTSDQPPDRPDEPPASGRPDHPPPTGPDDDGGDGGKGDGDKP
ncbi:MAG: hypothetical protein M3214_15070 [Actinomycetota bacterium]|nr:hypothetical protein [Actinomycetota bacterium]